MSCCQAKDTTLTGIVNSQTELDKERKEIEEAKLAFEKKKISLQTAKRRHGDLLRQPSEEANRQKIGKDLAKLVAKRLEAALRLPVSSSVHVKSRFARS